MKLPQFKAKVSSERGANLVEFALVLLLLLLLLAGVVDLGRAFNSYIVITNASREGARYGSRFPGHVVGIKDAVLQEADGSGVTLTASNVQVTVPNPARSGDTIRVEVSFDFQPVMVGILGVDTITMRRATEMVVFGFD